MKFDKSETVSHENFVLRSVIMKLTDEHPSYVYERLALTMQSQIKEGVFRVGDKLPSIRQICRRDRVSPGSVMQAFSLMEARGLVEAKAKSGFYVCSKRQDAGPTPNHREDHMKPTMIGVSDAVAEVFRAASDPKMVPFGAVVPDPKLLPTEKLSKSLSAVSRESPELIGRYDIGAGDPEFLRQLQIRLSSRGCNVAASEMVISSGVVEAINLAVRAVGRPGDIFAVESPCYFGVLEILESLGMRALPIPSTCDLGLNLKAMEKALENHEIKGLILVSNFSNPSGACISLDRKQQLLHLLNDFGVPLIEDDVYGELQFGEICPKPIKAFDNDGNVIYCSSFSKSLAPGFRVGWLAAGKYSEQVKRLKYISSVATPRILQRALLRFMSTGALDRHLRQFRRANQQQVARSTEAILENFPEGTAVSRPSGGSFLWVELPRQIDSFDLFREATKANISIAPGPIFCPHGGYRNFIRISCDNPWNKCLAEGFKQLGALAEAQIDANLKTKAVTSGQ